MREKNLSLLSSIRPCFKRACQLSVKTVYPFLLRAPFFRTSIAPLSLKVIQSSERRVLSFPSFFDSFLSILQLALSIYSRFCGYLTRDEIHRKSIQVSHLLPTNFPIFVACTIRSINSTFASRFYARHSSEEDLATRSFSIFFFKIGTILETIAMSVAWNLYHANHTFDTCTINQPLHFLIQKLKNAYLSREILFHHN